MTSAAEIPTHVAPRGRAAPITREQVFAAAWDLTRKGQRPSIDRIRMKLGGGTPRGSPNTVNAFLNDWWGQLALRLEERPGAALPFLPERVSGALEVLWNEALAAAKEVRDSETSAEAARLNEASLTLDARASELTVRERALEARAAALDEALALAREQLATASARVQALEAGETRRSEEIAALERQRAALEAEIRNLRAHFEHDRAKLQKRFDAAETRWMREINEARRLARARAQEGKRASAETRAARRESERLARELAKARATLAKGSSRRAPTAARRADAGKKRAQPKRT